MSDQHVRYGRGFLWNVVFAFVSRATFALVQILIANHLGPGPIGIFALLATIYNFAELMREAGLKQSFYNDTNPSPSRYATYCRLSLSSGITFGGVLFALAYPAARYYGLPDLEWCMAIAAAAVAINGFSAIPSAALLREGRFRDTGLIESVATLSAGATAVLFVWMGFGLLGLMLQLLMRSVVLFALYQSTRPISVRHYDRDAVRPIMRLCVQLVTTDVLWMFYSVADMLLVPKVLGAVANGSYGLARRLVVVPAELVFSPLHRTIIVAVGHRADDHAKLGRAMARTLGLALLLLIPIYLGLAIFARPLAHAILRRDLWPAADVLPILCISEASRAMGTFAATALVAAGRQKIPLLAWILPYPVAVSLLALNWSHLSLVSVAWSFAAGMVVVNVVVLAGGFTLLKSWIEEKSKLLKAAGCTTLTALFGYGLSLAPLSHVETIVVALIALPCFHLALIGMFFAGSPFAYTSPARIRNLRTVL